MNDAAAIFDSVTDFAGVIAVALIGAGVISVRGRVKRVQHQVENDHSTNMRVENDERHLENGKKLDTLIHGQDALKADIALLKTGWRTNRDDIDELMDTEQRLRVEQEMWGQGNGLRRDRRSRT